MSVKEGKELNVKGLKGKGDRMGDRELVKIARHAATGFKNIIIEFFR